MGCCLIRQRYSYYYTVSIMMPMNEGMLAVKFSLLIIAYNRNGSVGFHAHRWMAAPWSCITDFSRLRHSQTKMRRKNSSANKEFKSHRFLSLSFFLLFSTKFFYCHTFILFIKKNETLSRRKVSLLRRCKKTICKDLV